MSKYLVFEVATPVPGSGLKTDICVVRSAISGVELGRIKWFGRWRQYAFLPVAETIYNPECLQEIADQAAEMTRAHRAKARA